jgi:hypothetical protein
VRRLALRLGRDDSSFARPLARLETRLERDLTLQIRMRRLAATLRAAATTPEIRNIAVGTALAGRPPHRSGRAELPHPAPASGHDATSHSGLAYPPESR